MRENNFNIIGKPVETKEINLIDLGIPLSATGQALQNNYKTSIQEATKNPNTANAIGGSGIMDIIYNKDRLSSGISSIIDNTADYSKVNDIDTIINTWDNDSLQNKVNIVNPGAAFFGTMASSAGKGASIGNAIMPGIGIIGGGLIGGTLGAITGAVNHIQNQSNRNKLNSAIEVANKNSLISMQDAASRATQNSIRKDRMNIFDIGGDMTTFNVGGSHEQNPFGGIPQGIGANGKPNLVEEGEVKYKFMDGNQEEYIFPKRYKVTETSLKKAQLPTKYKGMSYADIAKEIQKPSEEQKDPITKRTVNSLLRRLQGVNEERLVKIQAKEIEKTDQQENIFADGDEITFSKLRYAPAIGSGIGALTALLQRPDYSYASQLEKLAEEHAPISTPRLGGYLEYTPFDINMQNASTAAARESAQRAISSNTNRANRAAGLIAINNAYNNIEGSDFLKWQQANADQKAAVEAYNNSINKANIAISQKDAEMNSAIENQRLALMAEAAKARDLSDTARATNIGATTTNLFNNIGNVGRDKDSFNMLREFLKANPQYVTQDLFNLFNNQQNAQIYYNSPTI